MELKYLMATHLSSNQLSSNRTFMELKSLRLRPKYRL